MSLLGRQLHVIVLAVVCALIATACVRQPSDGLAIEGFGDGRLSAGGESTGDPTGDATPGGATPGTASRPNTTTTTPGSSSQPGTSGATPNNPQDPAGPAAQNPGRGEPSTPAGESGDDGTTDPQPRETTRPPGNQPVQQGVDYDKRTVKVVYAYQQEDCGPDNAQQSRPNAKGAAVMQTYLDFFNNEVLKDVNWTIDLQTIDDGGRQCGDKAQAAGVQIVEEIKPFAVLGGTPVNGRGPVLADVVTRAGIPVIGITWNTFQEIAERAGLAWSTLPIAEEYWLDLVEYVDKRIKGTQVPNRDAPGAPLVDRVYGMLVPDMPEGRLLAQNQIARLKGIGIDIGDRLWFADPDLATASQTATNTILKMRQAGVNTVFWGFIQGATSSATYSQAAASQNYRPDILTAGYGVAFPWDSLHEQSVWEHAQGVGASALVANRVGITSEGVHPDFDEINENQSGYQKVWERAGNNDLANSGSNPNAYGTWTLLSAVATGILSAGDTLTWETWRAGMNSARPGEPNRCHAARFMGRDYPWDFTADWYSDGQPSRSGFTTHYWTRKQSTFNTPGMWESFDNYRKFQLGGLPPEATHDTGEQGYDIPKQERLGLRPWTPCSEFSNHDFAQDWLSWN